ncbi:MAG: penicillin acylase family protein [Ideonella sp.]|nr:penicillin acylase family protein [Ideonella sp.]
MNRVPMAPLCAAAAAVLLGACASPPPAGLAARSVTIQRTAHGVPHITAPDLETLAYGAAYAHAQDNVCQTARQLITARGERSRWFGAAQPGLMGRRMLPNEVSDFFIAAHMDDAALARAWAATSADAQALNRGYVAGYNRFLADQAGRLPADCQGQPWVRPMSAADFNRLSEMTMVQAGVLALADAVVGAQPPAVTGVALPPPATLTDAAQAMREAGLLDSPLGSNAWAFGRDTTANGRGMLLGNPHFPWMGVNRFWMLHATVPGQVDSMGATTGFSGLPSIGFNKDVAWSHTVSTGKRFTLHELTLVSGDPTSYLVDGRPEKMTPRDVAIAVSGEGGQVSNKSRRLWSTRWGPVLVIPRAGLNWTAKTAYAIQDANAGNARFVDSWLGFNRAASVQDLRAAHANLGIPWVNTLAADRHGNAMYADVSVVPDVDAAQIERCAPSAAAAALRGPTGLVVLDGSKSDCGWQRDPASPVPGLTPIARMAVAIRSDWVHNSNDGFFYTHPTQAWGLISPMVGDDVMRRPRTRAGLNEIPELIARGKVTLPAIQAQLFNNRNTLAQVVLPDLLQACAAGAPNAEAADGCQALRGWDRHNHVDSRGAHLFREFWRAINALPGLHRVPFDRARPTATPDGLNLATPAVAAKVWEALTQAVRNVRGAGFALDAPLGSVQRPLHTDEPIALHGGDEIEGVLNNLGNQFAPGISPRGLRIDYGSSYVQTVTFDERGPLAQAILTYSQSTDPASPHYADQTRLYSRKEWPVLPFHADDVARARIGEVLTLTRP